MLWTAWDRRPALKNFNVLVVILEGTNQALIWFVLPRFSLGKEIRLQLVLCFLQLVAWKKLLRCLASVKINV